MKHSRSLWLAVFALVLVAGGVAAGYKLVQSRARIPQWVEVGTRPLQAMIGADGQTFVVPAWEPGIPPEPSQLGAVQRLGRAGLEAADPSVAYKWLTGSAGERTILVQRAAGHPPRCLGVV